MYILILSEAIILESDSMTLLSINDETFFKRQEV